MLSAVCQAAAPSQDQPVVSAQPVAAAVRGVPARGPAAGSGGGTARPDRPSACPRPVTPRPHRRVVSSRLACPTAATCPRLARSRPITGRTSERRSSGLAGCPRPGWPRPHRRTSVYRAVAVPPDCPWSARSRPHNRDEELGYTSISTGVRSLPGCGSIAGPFTTRTGSGRSSVHGRPGRGSIAAPFNSRAGPDRRRVRGLSVRGAIAGRKPWRLPRPALSIRRVRKCLRMPPCRQRSFLGMPCSPPGSDGSAPHLKLLSSHNRPSGRPTTTGPEG
jgi:hypothetical protein